MLLQAYALSAVIRDALDTKDKLGCTALMHALFVREDFDDVPLFFRSAAPSSSRFPFSEGQVETVRLLLDAHAPINERAIRAVENQESDRRAMATAPWCPLTRWKDGTPLDRNRRVNIFKMLSKGRSQDGSSTN